MKRLFGLDARVSGGDLCRSVGRPSSAAHSAAGRALAGKLDKSMKQPVFLVIDSRAVDLRLARPSDREILSNYFSSLSVQSRHNRFLGAMSELPARELDRFVSPSEKNLFTVLATATIDQSERIVGEARFAVYPESESAEFGLSVGDPWQHLGIGRALVQDVEVRAASLGAKRVYGDTFYSNRTIVALARRFGYVATANPGDWRQVRFEKTLPEPQASACARR
ncbi:RimJ/RimL family protein N-acetyltransferase [Bradyrhizobium sp. USDA 4518]